MGFCHLYCPAPRAPASTESKARLIRSILQTRLMAAGGYNRAIFMPLGIGTQLGSHEIIALLGKGGMGEVYLARDTKLKREVAIKILPGEFSRDGDRVSRFQREAELLA